MADGQQHSTTTLYFYACSGTWFPCDYAGSNDKDLLGHSWLSFPVDPRAHIRMDAGTTHHPENFTVYSYFQSRPILFHSETLCFNKYFLGFLIFIIDFIWGCVELTVNTRAKCLPVFQLLSKHTYLYFDLRLNPKIMLYIHNYSSIGTRSSFGLITVYCPYENLLSESMGKCFRGTSL